MLPLTIRVSAVCFFLVSLSSFVFCNDRKLSSVLNPGCTNCTSNTTLLYITAEGSKDTIHEIWDFTQGIPTIIFSVTNINATMTIRWRNEAPEEFMFSEKPKYSFAVVFDKLIEYDDIQDIGQYSPHAPQKNYHLRDMIWTVRENITTEDEVMLKMDTRYFRKTESKTPGLVTVKLDFLPYKDYAAALPHLIHTADSSLVDISLVNLTTSSEYNSSRYAWHTTIVTTDPLGDNMHCVVRKSLDDEHTPGVFEIMELKSPESYWHNDGGYIQFRPVAYNGAERGVASSTVARVSAFTNTTMPRSSTVRKFFRKQDASDLLVQDIYISFGDSGDGYYRQHNYTDWSFSIGYGSPPVEGFSLFVILIISIGLGVPVLLAASGIAYVVTRRIKQRNSHRRFANE